MGEIIEDTLEVAMRLYKKGTKAEDIADLVDASVNLVRQWIGTPACAKSKKIQGTVGNIGDNLKAVIKYMDTGVASAEYTKALDAEVEGIKSDEKVRMQHTLLMEAYAHERSMGEYIKVVSLIRNAIGDFTTSQMSKYFKVKEKACEDVIACITTHPDWDDEQIADHVDWLYYVEPTKIRQRLDQKNGKKQAA